MPNLGEVALIRFPHESNSGFVGLAPLQKGSTVAGWALELHA